MDRIGRYMRNLLAKISNANHTDCPPLRSIQPFPGLIFYQSDNDQEDTTSQGANLTEQEGHTSQGVCGPFEPSISDVLDVKEFLYNKSKLPYELVDVIVDLAEYWPHTTTIFQEGIKIFTGLHPENREELVIVSVLASSELPINPQEPYQLRTAEIKSTWVSAAERRAPTGPCPCQILYQGQILFQDQIIYQGCRDIPNLQAAATIAIHLFG
jgi:hypothetical protein